jgi:hypothetical protein
MTIERRLWMRDTTKMASSLLFKIALISFVAVATAHNKVAPPIAVSNASTASSGLNVFDVIKYSASTSASASANSKVNVCSHVSSLCFNL